MSVQYVEGKENSIPMTSSDRVMMQLFAEAMMANALELMIDEIGTMIIQTHRPFDVEKEASEG